MMLGTSWPDGRGLKRIFQLLGYPKSQRIADHCIGFYWEMMSVLLCGSYSKHDCCETVIDRFFDIRGIHIFHADRSHYPFS
jgi:hypothetical protein